MLKIGIAALMLGLASPAMGNELVTRPPTLHPLPQGVPYLVVGAQPQRVSTLRFAIINGRRALIDGQTSEVVYFLRY
jgi:hypothetical protein